jgi:hypothetical protein
LLLSGLRHRGFGTRAQEFLMNGAHDVIDARGSDGEADVQFARALGNGNHADIIFRNDREQAAKNTAGAFHVRAEHRDDRDIAMHCNWIQNSMFQLRTEKSLQRVDDALGIGFAKD